MDRTVPAGAAILLDFIRKSEVGRKAYDVIYAYKQHKLAQPLTSITIGEIVDAQKFWSKNGRRLLFMRATLIDLPRNCMFAAIRSLTPNLQDRLDYHLLKRRGYESFMASTINQEEFGKRLAQDGPLCRFWWPNVAQGGW
ncbi:hypothetical protein [Chelativorans sp. J32]|uniref:hypothetical protein n=1 Tax=Chelativorans sp. J32 TaxID=935840 RepID=UPI0004AEFBB4|nr:hypothetical protein [Chelativorans sp. J32]